MYSTISTLLFVVTLFSSFCVLFSLEAIVFKGLERRIISSLLLTFILLIRKDNKGVQKGTKVLPKLNC